MTIHLPEELQSFIQAKVQSGQFPSEDAAVAEAVRRFRQWEQEQSRPAASRDSGDDARDPLLGSIGAMRDADDELDEIVADAMKRRREEPWREIDAERAERMDALQTSIEDMRAGRVIPAESMLAEMRRILTEKQGR
jgi:Arc/MetJ-type ribon-helix-helix transcriptional regulator